MVEQKNQDYYSDFSREFKYFLKVFPKIKSNYFLIFIPLWRQ
jgi:hypothetical protein